MNGNGVSQESWQDWALRVAERGLAAKWDAEYLTKFSPDSQQPVATGTGRAGVIVPQRPAPMLSPVVLLGGGLAVAAALYFLLRD
jgi:hypothetical protein